MASLASVRTTVARHLSSSRVASQSSLMSTLASRAIIEDDPASSAPRAPSAFEIALVSGGDDRSALNALHRNKYNVSPWPLSSRALFRGSCTCNPPTARGYAAAEALFDRLSGGETSYAEAMEDARRRLAAAFDLPEGTAVVLCPSGSDAEYVPVAIARALKGEDAALATVVRQHKEIGAGSAPAAGLEYFSASTPLGDGPVEIGARVGGTPDEVRRLSTPARDARGSPASPTDDDAETFLDAFFAGSPTDQKKMAIVHSVFGGKTGLRDAPVASTDSVLGVVDACQGRFTNAELRTWLEDLQNVVLVTGSKFYRGPPFSGAVFLPPSIADKLRQKAPTLVSHLSEFLCPADLPDALLPWRAALPSSNANLGLALRWEAALAEIEAATPYSVSNAERWAQRVTSLVREDGGTDRKFFGDTLDVFETNRCIVSLRLRRDPSAAFFGPQDLRRIYEWMTLDVSAAFLNHEAALDPDQQAAAATLCSIGQPVEVAADTGVLRLALGVDSLDAFVKDPEQALRDDVLLLTKLDLLAANFDLLAQDDVRHLLVPPVDH